MIFFLNFYSGVIWIISHILKDRMESATVHSNSTFQHPPCFSCLVIPLCITYDYPRVRRVAPNFSIVQILVVCTVKFLEKCFSKWLHRTLFCLQVQSFISPCGLFLVLFAALKHIFQFLNHFIICSEDKPCFSETKDFLQFQARSQHLVLVKSREYFCFYFLS